MKATTRNKIVLIVAVAVISFAIGVVVGVYGIPAFINQAVNQFYFHDHKVK
jgi:hypothetical protein